MDIKRHSVKSKKERLNSLTNIQHLDYAESKNELLTLQQMCGYNIGGIRQSFLKWRETISSKEQAIDTLASVFGIPRVADTIYNFSGGNTYDSQEELNKLATELLESMETYESDCLKRIPVGYLPVRGLSGLNTTASIRHEDKYFIIINLGLSEYLHSANKLLCSRISVDNRVSPPIDHITYLRLICAAIQSVLEMKRAPFLPIHMLDSKLIYLCGLLSRGQELFILAHEYGHYLAGHLEDKYLWTPISSNAAKNSRSEHISIFKSCEEKKDAVSLISAIEGNESASEISKELKARLENSLKMKAEEIEADKEGALLALNAIQRIYKDPHSVSLMTAGIDALFSVLDLFERVISGEADAQKHVYLQLLSSASHPASIQRRNTWRRTFMDLFDNDMKHLSGGFEEIVDESVNDIVNKRHGSFEALASEAEQIKML